MHYDEILDWMSIKHGSGVYALPSHAKVVTLAAQQTRAFNLVWALCESGRLERGHTVLVVGGGVAGITAAAAAASLGHKVTLVEQAQGILHLQRFNDRRYVHPNIVRWPSEAADNPRTSFPFLNWTAGTASNVVAQLSEGWDRLRSDLRITVQFNRKVVGLNEEAFGYTPRFKASPLSDGNDDPKLYNHVILAVGFGLEVDLLDPRKDAYWHNDAFDAWHEHTRALVSGCGDGGITDALRLRIYDFNHGEFVELMQKAAGVLREPLEAVEERVKRKLADGEIDRFTVGAEYEREYRNLTAHLPESVQENLYSVIATQSRKNIDITINDISALPYRTEASPLNRYAVFLLMSHNQLVFYSGTVAPIRSSRGYEVNLGEAEPSVFDLVVIRHGPTRDTLTPFTPSTTLPQLKERWSSANDPTVREHWPNHFFGVERASYRVDVYSSGRAEASTSFWARLDDPARFIAAVARILVFAGGRVLDESRLKLSPDMPVSRPDLGLIYGGTLFLMDVWFFTRPVTATQVRQFYDAHENSYRSYRWSDHGTAESLREEISPTSSFPRPILIASNGFTAEAKHLAGDHAIKLWGIADLVDIAAGAEAALSLLLSDPMSTEK